MQHRFLLSPILYVSLCAPSLLGVEALTSAHAASTEKKAVRDREALLLSTRLLLETYDTQFRQAALTLATSAPSAFAQSGYINTATPTASLSALGPTLDERAKWPAATKDALQQYAEAEARYQSTRAIVDRLERSEPTLESLETAASLQLNAGNTSAGVVPSLDFLGKFDISSTEHSINGQVQFLVNIRPDPPAGTAADVAQAIRTSTGVFTGNLGLNVSHFRTKAKETEGSQGIELRVGVPVSYQRAAATGSADSQTSASSTTDFGLVAPELKLSIWLRSVLIGYKFNYYVAFGASGDVYSALQHTSSHKAYLAARIDALSAKPNALSTGDSPFYVEASYTGAKDSLGNGTFGIAFGKTLSWPAR